MTKKIKNYLYYVNDDDELYRVDLSTASFPEQGTAIDISDISGTATIIAMAVDEEGMLYIADAGDTGVDGDDSFIKFNPNTEQVIKSYSTNIDFRQGEIPVNLGSIQNLSDIIISYGYVYLLNFGVTNGNLILKFNTDLELIDGYGTKAPDLATDTARGHFYGPHIFAGLRKDKFYILDEMGSQQMGLGYDKLISMDDMDGNNWDYNDSFPFFYDC